jgi:hypothetical protein
MDDLDSFIDEKIPANSAYDENIKDTSDFTYDLVRDLEETFGLKAPLEMRYTTDGTHCIATWNMNNGFDADTIVKVMLQCTISIMFIQEPKKKVTKVDTGFMNKALLKYGLKGYFSQHQFLIYNDATLGARVQDVKCELEGRIITCYVQIGAITSKDYIKITGCYAVPQGDFIYEDESTRVEKRKRLYDKMRSHLKPRNPLSRTEKGFKSVGKHITGEIILGDLQETMTTTSRDNIGGTKYKRLAHGLLQAIEDSGKTMSSVVFEKEGQQTYITREPLSGAKGGRGISHIMVDRNMEDLYVGGCVDPILSSSSCGTADHHIVAADFDLGAIAFTLYETNPTTRYKWGAISKILMTYGEVEGETGEPQLCLKKDTKHTDEWRSNCELYKKVHEEMNNNPKTVAAGHTFCRKMDDLRSTLREASGQLSRKEQEEGQLIVRRPEYKKALEDAWAIFKASMEETAINCDLKTEEDPIARLQKHVKSMKDPRDRCGQMRATATFTSVISNIRYIRATAKALHRAGKKLRNVPPDSKDASKYHLYMKHLANKITNQTDQYKIGERLVEAIEKAEATQAEREIVQDTYAKHRDLDRFRGKSRGQNSLNLNVNDRLLINNKLKNAGCNHLFDTTHDVQCEVVKCDEVKNWNKVKECIETYQEDVRLIDVTSDKKFHDAIEETIEKLESMSRTATNQRATFKRLHIRHAALTMSTKDLSRLLLQKAGDLPEPEHMIYDEDLGEDRPCQSSEEVMTSTKVKTQHYMNPSSAERQNHFCTITNDDVGPSAISIETNRLINDDTMAKCMPQYEKLSEEAKEFSKEAHRKFKTLLTNPLDEAPELRYAFFMIKKRVSFRMRK